MNERKPLMAGNWKMNLNHFEAIALVQKLAFALSDEDLSSVEVAVLPPFTDIRSVQTVVEGDHYAIKYGAQDVSPHAGGAYTGEISGSMLARLGCSFVTVGHSERRDHHNETNGHVAAKASAALAHGIAPIICVGEKLDTRKQGEHVHYVLKQVRESISGLSIQEIGRTVLAYEPVWAIGTGEVATGDDAQEVCSAIRKALEADFGAEVAHAIRILYGGSVKATNVAGIMAQPDVDGCLVGGASLDSDEFIGIVRYRLHPTPTV